MKNILLTIIFSCITVAAFSQGQKFNISAGSGLFSEDFNWSIAGNLDGKAPNILSELIWRNLKGPQYNFSADYALTSRIAVNADFLYGKINSGAANDADYLEDNRRESVFDETFISNKGHFQHLSLNLVLKKELSDQLLLNALVGYDNLVQELYLLEDPNNPVTEGLDSYYKNNWNGLQLGLNLKYRIAKFSVSGKIRGGFYKYYANADWNLIPDFEKPVSFEQKAVAYKYSGSLQLAYSMTRHLEVNGALNMSYGASFAGKDYAYFTDDTTAVTKFNGAELKSRYAQLGLSLIF